MYTDAAEVQQLRGAPPDTTDRSAPPPLPVAAHSPPAPDPRPPAPGSSGWLPRPSVAQVQTTSATSGPRDDPAAPRPVAALPLLTPDPCALSYPTSTRNQTRLSGLQENRKPLVRARRFPPVNPPAGYRFEPLNRPDSPSISSSTARYRAADGPHPGARCGFRRLWACGPSVGWVRVLTGSTLTPGRR